MARRDDLFTTIRTEGALLPSDLLARIGQSDGDLAGLKPADYHLNPNERLGEMVNRSWNRLTGAWAAFTDGLNRLPASDLATTTTRERWLLILFDELGYGRLQPSRGISVDGRTFAVSHEWGGTVPLHLVGARIDLDRRTPGVAGAARSSPHSLTQELLNESPDHLWGVVSNGLRLRLLRDNAALTRQAYVEFDLQAMMEGQVYSDFVLLWLLLHESRFEAARPDDCWLERWAKEAELQGTRALDRLRSSVEDAVGFLGQGFIAHPSNHVLTDALRSGALAKEDYYRELLRLVYRLIFLFVAEDRGLLLDPHATQQARRRYLDYYSMRRLRRLAEARRGTLHSDLYESVKIVARALDEAGSPALALPALGSFLWSLRAVPYLSEAKISNRDFLPAIHALAFTVVDGVRRHTDYRNLGAEELGSVYEALLELQPGINLDARTFELRTSTSHERRATSSYYTSAGLIRAMLDEALEPLLREASSAEDPVQALLNLKVVDPACGSGHFLIMAAHRIAKRVGAFRTGDDEPSPEAVRSALREVIGRCIYGVDLNPMAVELCKVSLWMEALEPGKPLSFLDHRILRGNAVVGATPEMLAGGIPDEAYAVVEGDDPLVAASRRKKNSRERAGEQALQFTPDDTDAGYDLAAELRALDDLEDTTIAAVHEKERRVDEILASVAMSRAKAAADAWCAAYLLPKREDSPEITTDTVRRLLDAPSSVDAATRRAIKGATEEYGTFHWHLAFPDVFHARSADDRDSDTGWGGGFDLAFGNPPWKSMSPDLKEFFSAYEPQVRFLDKTGQEALVADILQDPLIDGRWRQYRRQLYSQAQFFKTSGRFRLFAPGNLGKGDFDIYRMFVETVVQVTRLDGWATQVVKAGLYNSPNCMAIRQRLFSSFRWTWLLGFVNTREYWFRGIDSRTTFCIYIARKSGETREIHAAFGLATDAALTQALKGNTVSITLEAVRAQSPEALAISEQADSQAQSLSSRMYAAWPMFGDEEAGPPLRRYMREVDMGTERGRMSSGPPGFPVYEGRMVDAFDHRAKAYRSGRGRSAVWEQLQFGSPAKTIAPQWWIRREQLPPKVGDRLQRYRVGFCDVVSPTNARSLIAALLPPGVIAGHKVPTFTYPPEWEWAYMLWLSIANSFVMDFLVRQKVATTMSLTVLDSLPFPRLPRDDARARVLVPLALHLTCTSAEMGDYWTRMAACGWVQPISEGETPPGYTNPVERANARATVDAIVARDLFHLSREELADILDAFTTSRKYDEKEWGEFRTKRLILERYDEGLVAVPSDVERLAQWRV